MNTDRSEDYGETECEDGLIDQPVHESEGQFECGWNAAQLCLDLTNGHGVFRKGRQGHGKSKRRYGYQEYAGGDEELHDGGLKNGNQERHGKKKF